MSTYRGRFTRLEGKLTSVPQSHKKEELEEIIPKLPATAEEIPPAVEWRRQPDGRYTLGEDLLRRSDREDGVA